MQWIARLAFLALPVMAVAQGKVQPGVVYAVNISPDSASISLNGGAFVSAPPMSAAPALSSSGIKLGVRAAETPKASVLATGKNTISVRLGTASAAAMKASFTLGPLPPLSSPLGLSHACVAYVLALSAPSITIVCGDAHGRAVLVTAPLIP